MLTAFDKVIAALLPSVILFLNQKFGWHLNTDPDTLTALAAALGGVLVYFVPNKPVPPPQDNGGK